MQLLLAQMPPYAMNMYNSIIYLENKQLIVLNIMFKLLFTRKPGEQSSSASHAHAPGLAANHQLFI